MDTLLNSLVNILEREYEYYSQLNELAVQKKDAIITNDVEGLAELVKEDDQVINHINELELERISISEKLIDFNKLKEFELNFNKIIELSSDEYKNKLKGIRENLIQIIDQLHEQNEQNSLLIEEAVKLNQFSLSMMMNFLEPDAQTYNSKQNNDNKDSNRVTRLLDRRG